MIRALFDRWRGSLAPWTIVPQAFIGSFFLAAASYKTSIYFFEGRTLMDDFAFWEGSGYPPLWYRWFIHTIFAIPYGHRFLELTVIGTQGLAGMLLVLNRRTRIAGWLLLFVQANVFLGTLHHRGFNEFVGTSLIMALYFVLRDRTGTWSPRNWNIVTGLIAAVTALYLYNRAVMGDPWPSSMEWQRLDLQQDVMSSFWAWKAMILGLADTAIGPYLWAAPWWICGILTALIATRLRSYAMAGLLIFAILRTITWNNSVTSEGVVFVLLYFLWLVDERQRVRV